MKQHLQLLAGYHVWAFETLFEALLPLDDDRYRADCGLFFRSIHGTLNHLLVADSVWFGRVIGQPFTVSGLDAELESERETLEQRLCAHSAHWQHWLKDRSAAEIAAPLAYSNMSGTRFKQETATLLLHVVNHASHHRGQISAAITGFGLDAPEMDLIWYLRRVETPLG
ncbi:MAG: DinB family protein [Gammaproteobacteria bacterium]|nr:DinB family protein [Gammaproteobacteria bacterium]